MQTSEVYVSETDDEDKAFSFPQVVVVAPVIRPTSWEAGPGLGGFSQTPKGDKILKALFSIYSYVDLLTKRKQTQRCFYVVSYITYTHYT